MRAAAPVRSLPARPAAAVPGRPGRQLRRGPRPCSRSRSCDDRRTRPKLAVWKLASCDGCQLTLLDCEDELLALAGAVEIAHFTEASSAATAGPYDVSLVEGSVTTERDARAHPRDPARSPGSWSPSAPAPPPAGSRRCATSPTSPSSPRPCTPGRTTSRRSRPPRRSPTTSPVDFELRGCPIDKRQLLELITALLAGRKPQHPGAQRLLSSASCAATPASWSRAASRASGRSPRPAAARSARPSTAAATAASARWPTRTPPR